MPEPLMRYLIWPLVKFLIAFIIVQVIVAAMNWVERRLLGLMQARLGPNRVGREFGIPWGLAQIVADPQGKPQQRVRSHEVEQVAEQHHPDETEPQGRQKAARAVKSQLDIQPP